VIKIRGKTPISLAAGYLRGLAWTVGAVPGLRQKARVVWFALVGRRLGSESEPVSFPMRGLGGRSVLVRPRTDDLSQAVYNYHGGLYLPPEELVGNDLRQIVELGSNMGSALAGLASAYPGARLVGVEPDPGNAAIARRNVAQFGERCEVVEEAIWDSPAELSIEGDKTVGFTVRERRPTDGPEVRTVRATTIDAILAKGMPTGPIDYMTVTIEGTEPRLLRAGGDWVERTRSIRVEYHPERGFSAALCIELLEALGFRAGVTSARYADWHYVIGVRS
jgi:FkbM family methyltransferase